MPSNGTAVILGLSRSGTTLLNMVLGAHPKVTALGELYNWYAVHNPHLKGTAAPHAYFGQDQFKGQDPKRAMCSKCLSPACPVWSNMPVAPCDKLYSAIRAYADTPWIVDSSKYAHYYEQILPATEHETLRPLIIFKTVWGFTESIARRVHCVDCAERLSENQLQHAARWWASEHLIYKQLLERLGLSYRILSYQAFAENPRRALTPFLGDLELEWEPTMLNWATADLHQIGGNPRPNQAVRSRNSTISVDPNINSTPQALRDYLMAQPDVARVTTWLSEQ